jgi:hypothetical protein
MFLGTDLNVCLGVIAIGKHYIFEKQFLCVCVAWEGGICPQHLHNPVAHTL